MTPQEVTNLRHLLTTFNATALGEGDVNAGTNLLATMAITLANLSRTGSGVQQPGLSRMRVGSSLLVSGSLSPSLVMDSVVTEVGIRQNVLTAQLHRLIGDKIADARSEKLKVVEFPKGPEPNYAENALFQLEQPDQIDALEVQKKWRDVLSVPPNPRIEDLAGQPKFLVTARGPKDLEKRLVGLHDNRPLVALQLNRPENAAAYGGICEALLGGHFPVGDFGETAGGHLLVCDPTGVLGQIARKASEHIAWLGRMVWLVDTTVGPDASESQPAEGKIRVDDMGARFGEALTAVLAKRLDNHNAGPVVHKFDICEAQPRWVAFLTETEDRLPGITGTARALLATLAFGLTELAAARNCERLPITVAGVEALARWIIRRMANARNAMIRSAENTRLLQLEERILHKLADGWHSPRQIVRRFNQLTMRECRLALQSLGGKGKVISDGSSFSLSESAAAELRILTLET